MKPIVGLGREDGRQHVGSRATILGTLIIATIVVDIPTFFSKLSSPIDWLLLCSFVSCALMTLLPFVLARLAPRAAAFNTQSLPTSCSHWGWFFLLLLAVLCASRATFWLTNTLGFRGDRTFLFCGEVTRAKVVLLGILGVLLYPTAEEIFWRGYVLEQLRKLTRARLAVLVESSLFALGHLLLRGVGNSISAFFVAVLLSLWRVKFRALVPLILTHIVLNAVALVPQLKTLYRGTAILGKPKVADISRLTYEPAAKALPSLIGFLSDEDQDVCNYASVILLSRYRNDAEPYLKDALSSKDAKLVNAVLSIVEIAPYPALKDDVRRVAWSAADPLSAMITLMELHDLEGLQEIAKSHPQEKVRRFAESMVKTMNTRSGRTP
jgi:membrane protease YdiL (CAAX protease family)